MQKPTVNIFTKSYQYLVTHPPPFYHSFITNAIGNEDNLEFLLKKCVLHKKSMVNAKTLIKSKQQIATETISIISTYRSHWNMLPWLVKFQRPLFGSQAPMGAYLGGCLIG